MELRHIRYFLAVAEQRNFTRAAEKLGIAQPPLSQQIQALEGELGGPLFRRVPQGAELTPAGDAFLVEAKLTIAAAERAKLAAMRAQRGAIGRLLLGITSSATFNQIIGSTIDEFHRTWPDVQLALEELTTAALYERVLRGELDMAFVRPGDGDPSGVNLLHLPDEATFIALPANHRLAHHETLRLTEIAREPFIAFPRELGPSLHDEIVFACQANGFTPNVMQYVQHNRVNRDARGRTSRRIDRPDVNHADQAGRRRLYSNRGSGSYRAAGPCHGERRALRNQPELP